MWDTLGHTCDRRRRSTTPQLRGSSTNRDVRGRGLSGQQTARSWTRTPPTRAARMRAWWRTTSRRRSTLSRTATERRTEPGPPASDPPSLAAGPKTAQALDGKERGREPGGAQLSVAQVPARSSPGLGAPASDQATEPASGTRSRCPAASSSNSDCARRSRRSCTRTRPRREPHAARLSWRDCRH